MSDLTKWKIDRIKKLSVRGLADAQIAEIMHVKEATVEKVLGKHKDGYKRPEMDKEAYAITNPRCKKCIYRSNLGHESQICCYYIVRTGLRRGCSVKDCDKFKKGHPIKDKFTAPGVWNEL